MPNIKSQKQKGFPSMGKTTAQMQGKMAAVPCHHGGGHQGMVEIVTK